MSFRAPVRDLAFALKTVGHSALMAQAFPDLDEETVVAVLESLPVILRVILLR